MQALKYLLILLSVLVGFVLNWSCNSAGCCAVEKNATLFLNAVSNKNITEAKKYCTTKACLFIDSCINYSVFIELPKVQDVKCEVKGEKATCTFCCLLGSYNDSFGMIRMKPKPGEDCNNWVVDDLSRIFSKD